jgi:large subunit ribosomal protein L15
MKLNEIRDNPGAHYKFKAIGRGIGSGKGKTSGRGGKGQSARSGYVINGFEGGQTPLHRRIPKRGFNRKFLQAKYHVINLGRIQAAVDAGKIKPGADIDGATLVAAGILRRTGDGVRLLAKGEIKTKLNFTVVGASKAAIAAVEKSGGTVTLTAPVATGEEKEKAK